MARQIEFGAEEPKSSVNELTNHQDTLPLWLWPNQGVKIIIHCYSNNVHVHNCIRCRRSTFGCLLLNTILTIDYFLMISIETSKHLKYIGDMCRIAQSKLSEIFITKGGTSRISMKCKRFHLYFHFHELSLIFQLYLVVKIYSCISTI